MRQWLDRHERLWHGGAIAAVSVLLYVNSLWNRFALDDVYIVQHNPRVHALRDLGGIWATPYWPFYGDELGLYRPLAIFAYAIEWAIGDGAPWVFHLANILLHAGVAILVYLLVRRLVSATAGFIGGMLFAIHPVHTEAVANIVGQAELIAAATVLAACVLHVTRPGAAVDWKRRLAYVALLLTGMLAKESAIVLPGLLVALDLATGRVQLTRRGWLDYGRAMALPLFLIVATTLAYIILRISIIGSLGGVAAAPNLPFLRTEYRVWVAFRAWPEYVRLLFFPADLSSDYSPGVILPVEGLTPMTALGLGLLLVTAVLALLTPLWPGAGLPAAFFLISIMPVSNLLLPIGVVVAERVLYLPSVAVSLAAGYAWAALGTAANVRARRIALAAAALAGVAMSVHVVQRNPDWRDTAAVWQALVRDHPESYRAQIVNSVGALQSGNRELARQYLELAYRIWPSDPLMLTDLAALAIADADYTTAIALLEDSKSIAPFAARNEAMLAYVYLLAGRPDDALASLREAERLGPLDDRTRYALFAQIHAAAGRHDQAVGAWRVALKSPGTLDWIYWSGLARELARTGRTDLALAAADSAHAHTEGFGTAPRADVRALADAIRRNCYRPQPDRAGSASEATTCADPLADWGVILPTGSVQ
jgi:protein O-mannosyl-transferase